THSRLSPFFPYTTLFRSRLALGQRLVTRGLYEFGELGVGNFGGVDQKALYLHPMQWLRIRHRGVAGAHPEGAALDAYHTCGTSGDRRLPELVQGRRRRSCGESLSCAADTGIAVLRLRAFRKSSRPVQRQ